VRNDSISVDVILFIFSHLPTLIQSRFFDFSSNPRELIAD